MTQDVKDKIFVSDWLIDQGKSVTRTKGRDGQIVYLAQPRREDYPWCKGVARDDRMAFKMMAEHLRKHYCYDEERRASLGDSLDYDPERSRYPVEENHVSKM